MKTFTRVISAIVLLLALASLAACGQPPDANAGTYTCVYLQKNGENMQPAELYSAAPTLELLSGGKAVLSLAGENYNGRWTLSNGAFSLTTDGGTSRGTLSDGVCIINLLDAGLGYVFLRDGDSLPAGWDGLSNIDPAQTELQRLWNGGWYGWWAIENASGSWADLDRQVYDCFAYFNLGDDRSGHLILWDEQMSADDPMADVEIVIVDQEDENPMGVASSTGGSFWLMQLEPDDWRLDPTALGYENMLCVNGAHYESDEGSFDYTIVLRPWGMRWDDVAENAPELLPYFYSNWYIPSIEAGMSIPAYFDETQVIKEEIVMPTDDD